ncbi:MAG: hypothetical protein EKK29_09800 [Hyphomicrobiales bacterium]|nr:MAG: hypothetical protein EKK29_09800 [Hyphomicrobiales bacterium]
MAVLRSLRKAKRSTSGLAGTGACGRSGPIRRFSARFPRAKERRHIPREALIRIEIAASPVFLHSPLLRGGRPRHERGLVAYGRDQPPIALTIF